MLQQQRIPPSTWKTNTKATVSSNHILNAETKLTDFSEFHSLKNDPFGESIKRTGADVWKTVSDWSIWCRVFQQLLGTLPSPCLRPKTPACSRGRTRNQPRPPATSPLCERNVTFFKRKSRWQHSVIQTSVTYGGLRRCFWWEKRRGVTGYQPQEQIESMDAHTWVSHMNTDAGVHMRTQMHASDAAMLKSFRGHADKRRVKQSSSVDGEQSQSRPPSRGGRSYWCTSVTAGELSNGDETQSARTDTFGRKLKGEFEIKIKVTAGKPISSVFLPHLLASFALIHHHFPSTATPNRDSLFICHQ